MSRQRVHSKYEDEGSQAGLSSPYDADPVDEGDLWFLPPEEEDDASLEAPLPQADRRSLLDAREWLAGQGAHAADLARAAMAVGRLEEVAAAMGPGAATRLALLEVEALMWAAGTPVRREEIGRELTALRADTDLHAMRLARWGLRRLQGQGDALDLRGFLALHRAEAPGMDEVVAPRLQGRAFDEAAEGFHLAMDEIIDAHPITRGAYGRVAWRLADLSPEEDLIEAAIWSAREMAQGCSALPFVPVGSFGRRVWQGSAPVADRLGDHYRAVADGAIAARAGLIRLRDWAARARVATAKIKGDNPGRVIDALLAHPIALTATVEAEAGISRDTAERLLARMAGMGLVREVTGAARFRLWTAAA